MFAGFAVLALSFAQGVKSLEPDLRAEVAQRLRQLEADWSNSATGAMHERSIAHVERAEQRYFQGDLTGCVQALDAARLALRSQPWSAAAYEALALSIRRRLVDAAQPVLAASLSRLYGHGDATEVFIAVSAALDGGESRELEQARSPQWTPLDLTLDLSICAAGDHALRISWTDTDFARGQRELVVSLVADRDARLAALDKAVLAQPAAAPKLELDTAQMQIALLRSLADGSAQIHDYPGARLLQDTEQVVASAAKGERWYGPAHPGEFWLALPVEGGTVRTRVLVPAGLSKDRPAVLVLALHGASFDEDTWFDGYGGGASADLCRKRGWLLAAPRCAADDSPKHVEATIDALAAVYPIDRSKVFLLAHSRGAVTALRACAASPERYRGVAAIGGAVSGDALAVLATKPLFLAAGDHDFAREAVADLNSALIEKEAKRTQLTIYPNVEHWLAVQAALPDAFGWFDALAK